MNYKRFCAAVKLQVTSTMDGPPPGMGPLLTPDRVDGIKAGTLAAFHTVAALIADDCNYDRDTVYRDCGLDFVFQKGNMHEHKLDATLALIEKYDAPLQ